MTSRKKREIIRQRRIEFDRKVAENRDNMMAFVEESKKEPEKKKRGRPKKKVSE